MHRKANLTSKLCVLEAFLGFVKSYISLTEARIATLGGLGWEAQLWQRLGIPCSHGWIIESDWNLARNLRARFKYDFCPSLDTFPRLLRHIHKGEVAAIDAFHLDLTGAIDTKLKSLKGILPLLFSGNTRCLAITVADQRLNYSSDDQFRIMELGEELFGKALSQTVFQRFLQEQSQIPRPTGVPAFFQPADPRKGALREFSVLLHLCRLYCSGNGHDGKLYLPDEVKRYVYISRWSGRSFRMRTYFFHFGNDYEVFQPEPLIKAWLTGALAFVHANGKTQCISVSNANLPIEHPLRKETEVGIANKTVQFERLRTIAEAAGGDIALEYQRLITLVREADSKLHLAESRAEAAESKVSVALKALEGGGTKALKAAILLPSGKQDKTEASPVRQSRRRVVNEHERKVALPLKLLRAKADGSKEEFNQAREEVITTLGIGRKSNRYRTVGAMYAHTQRLFRGKWVALVLRLTPADSRSSKIKELAELFTKLSPDKKEVTVEQLYNEASTTERKHLGAKVNAVSAGAGSKLRHRRSHNSRRRRSRLLVGTSQT